MIVKVQLPVLTTEEEPMALIYTEDRSLDMMGPISTELIDAMDGELRAFFEAEVVGEQFRIIRKVEEQGW